VSPAHSKLEPTPFEVNMSMAVLADRGELGLNLAEVAALLPHDTPGSSCWHEHDVAERMCEVRGCISAAACCVLKRVQVGSTERLCTVSIVPRFLPSPSHDSVTLHMCACLPCFLLQVFLTAEHFNRKLNQAGFTYDTLQLLKTYCDVMVAADGSHLQIIQCNR
jgi:hypothetical protein